MLSDLPPQLIALAASLSYAASGISARRGLRYSTPITVTLVSLLVHAFGLGAVLLLTTGVPNVPPLVLLLFFITGTLQPVIRVFTYAGIFYMGASRGTTVRSCHPLFSTSLAIIFLGESANIWILAGTVLIVGGVTLTSWQPASERAAYRWWHIGFPLGAALLAGISHPIRRYALGLANEPLSTPRWWAGSRCFGCWVTCQRRWRGKGRSGAKKRWRRFSWPASSRPWEFFWW